MFKNLLCKGQLSLQHCCPPLWTQGIKPRNHALFWPDQLSCTRGWTGRKFEYSSWLVPWIYPCLSYGEQLSHFLARGHFLLPYGQFPRPARKSTCPGTTARDFFRALLHSLVLHCASLTAHNKMAAVKKGMQGKRNAGRNALRIFGCVWFLPRLDSTCCWNVHNVSSTRVAEFDFLTGEPHTCQVSRLRRDCHACGSKTWISRLLTPVFLFVTPGRKVWAITALTDTFWKIY